MTVIVACLHNSSTPVVYTDLDHTIIGLKGDIGIVPAKVEALESTGVPVVPVTAKTIYEIVYLNRRLGLGVKTPFIAVAESGAAVYADPGVLPYTDGSLTVYGKRLEYLKLYDGPGALEIENELENILGVILERASCPPNSLVSVRRLSDEELARISGLPVDEARLIKTRVFMAVYYGRSRECRARVADMLGSMGYYTGVGRNFLHVGLHKGKAYAVSLVHNIVPLLRGRIRIAAGDSNPDKAMLEDADYPVVIPNPGGRRLILSRGDYIVAPYPAPKGWEWLADRILLYLTPLGSCG